MWDKKRQLVWIAGGLIIGTYIAYSDSLDNGKLVVSFFIFMESLIVIIMGVLFWLYSRKGR